MAQRTRKTLKILHSLAACGMIGALAGYGILLTYGPQDTPQQYADLRASISTICDYLLVPSLAVALVSGLIAMAVHAPFLDQRWAWAKALLGISMFEGTLGFVGHKASAAAEFSVKVADGLATQAQLHEAIASEWQALAVVLALTVANVVLGVWRPAMRGRRAASQAGPGDVRSSG